MKVTLQVGDQTQTLRILRRGQRLDVTFEDGREVTLRLLSVADGGFEVEHDHARIHGAGTVVGGGERQLWVNGRMITYRRVQQAGVARREAVAPGGLTATIPAVVLEILVQTGDAVTSGQKLILLESMKMVLPIQASHDGVVTAIHCAVGQSVQPGLPLIELS